MPIRFRRSSNSQALKVEKVIAGKSQGLVRFGPLAPGRYEFVGDITKTPQRDK